VLMRLRLGEPTADGCGGGASRGWGTTIRPLGGQSREEAGREHTHVAVQVSGGKGRTAPDPSVTALPSFLASRFGNRELEPGVSLQLLHRVTPRGDAITVV
jgi:hypothetical protein